MVYLESLRQELAEALAERDRLDARIDQLEDAIEALARLDAEPGDEPPRRASTFAREPGDEPPRRAPAFAREPGDEPPRRMAMRDEPPRGMEPRQGLGDLLERYRDDITDQIESLEASLPFVGLKYYRDQLLPQVVGEARQGELRSLMDLLVDSGVVDVYQVENPNNPAFPTAAIRLPLTDELDELDELDDLDELDEIDEIDENDEVDELDELDKVDELDELDKVNELDELDEVNELDEPEDAEGSDEAEEREDDPL